MDQAVIYAKYIFAVVGTAILSLIGGWDMALQVLVILVVIDYATGLTAAWVTGTLSSSVGFKGITKKILLFIPVVIGVCIDNILGQEILRSLAIMFYVANEGLSILENLGRAGVAIPEPIKRALAALKESSEKGHD